MRPKPVCPACGDPRPFQFWIDTRPPIECPNEPGRTAGICAVQRADAERAALWRKTAPEAFDAMGNILPGGLGIVMARLYPNGAA